MKYSEFKQQLSDLFEKFEKENDCVIGDIEYKCYYTESNTGKKIISTRNFNITLK